MSELNMGLQPLDEIMLQHHLLNHDVVEAHGDQLSHKAVQKARKGRKLTKRMQQKITAAVNASLKLERHYQDEEGVEHTVPPHNEQFLLEELFNYTGE